MTGNHTEDDGPLEGLSRRDLIKRIVVGSAFALPVVASFDMASLGVSSAYANNPNQSTYVPVSFASATSEIFTVGEPLTFAIVTPGSGLVNITETGKLPKGLVFTPIGDNYEADNDVNATISGKPAAGTGGLYPITLKASDNQSKAAQKFTVIVNEAPKFTSAAKTTVQVGEESTVKVTTAAYPHAEISVSGKLPKGMHFKSNPVKGTASISGKPEATGVHKLKLTAVNGVTPHGTQELVITVKS